MNAPQLFAAAGGSAEISNCGQYRYRLTRTLAANARIACFVMLNPSTADASRDDNTIRRCIGYARQWGCGELMVVNLFGFRATDPRYLALVRDPVGPDNNDYLVGGACRAIESGGLVVAAWGVHGEIRDQDRYVMALLDKLVPLQCLGVTVDGFPRHPLYLTRETPLQPYLGRPLNRS